MRSSNYIHHYYEYTILLASVICCYLLSGQSCSVDDDRESIDRLRASSEQHKRQLRSNQLDVRKSEQKIKDLTINIRCYLHV